jgi:NADH-quinone oxidoreductase subunit A
MSFEYLNNNYIFLFFFLVIVITLSVVLFLISYFLASNDNYFEKASAYECGFEPFEDTRIKFDVKFYLVGILFLVFDIEVMFMYP